jgi:hypothetical protein
MKYRHLTQYGYWHADTGNNLKNNIIEDTIIFNK